MMMITALAAAVFLFLVLVANLLSASASNPRRLRSGGGTSIGLPLDVFQRVLHTSLDKELELIAMSGRKTEVISERHPVNLSQLQEFATKPYSIRRRGISSLSTASKAYSPEQIWIHLLNHAWRSAESITRIDNNEPSSLTLIPYEHRSSSSPYDQHSCPFLLCSNSGADASSFFEEDDQSFLRRITIISGGNYCVVLTATSNWARQAMELNHDIIAQPLVDVMKIASGTIESVTSPAWRVPFQDLSNSVPQESSMMSNTNSSEDSIAILQNHWERTLTIDLVPGLEVHEEDDIWKLVGTIIHDIQSMSEVGWLMRQPPNNNDDREDQDWQEQYLMDHSLVGVPSLSEMFSLTTSSCIKTHHHQDKHHYHNEPSNKNDRLAFWDASLANGLESQHACTSLFATLFVDPHDNSKYNSRFTLVLNPIDAPPSDGYDDSSASNVDCVISLIAGLAVHPLVMSVKSNVPVYTGWSLAHSLDSRLR